MQVSYRRHISAIRRDQSCLVMQSSTCRWSFMSVYLSLTTERSVLTVLACHVNCQETRLSVIYSGELVAQVLDGPPLV